MSHLWRLAFPAAIAIAVLQELLDPPGARGDLSVTGGVYPNVNLGFGPNGDIGFLNSPTNLSCLVRVRWPGFFRSFRWTGS